MKSQTTRRFRELTAAMPVDIQEQARRAYLLFASDPNHPSLRFKRLNTSDDSLYSVRVSRRYRAVGTVEGDTVTWFWIGSHADYDREIAEGRDEGA